jgi:carbamoyltransferase
MVILGMHFGHDAAVSVFRDGKEVSYLLRERYVRKKHAISLDEDLILEALNSAGLSYQDIDYCAITSTQDMELMHPNFDSFSIKFEKHADHSGFSTLPSILQQSSIKVEDILIKKVIPRYLSGSNKLNPAYHEHLSEFSPIDHKTFKTTGWIDKHYEHPEWKTDRTLDDLAHSDIQDVISDENVLRGFCYPVTVRLGKSNIAGYMINHHLAHAASSFYRSPFKTAAIHTHDGNNKPLTFNNGGYFLGVDSEIIPICPHHLNIGHIYDFVGLHLKLGPMGPAGKLMGLAPYGEPVFFDRSFVGNQFDWQKIGQVYDSKTWITHCLRTANKLKYDMKLLEVPSTEVSKIKADIASSTQRLFEEIILKSVQTLKSILKGNDIATQNLCLSGGTALNCPANSRLAQSGLFENIFIEPNCDDGGVATGAASYVFYQILNNKRFPSDSLTPYCGKKYNQNTISRTLANYQFVEELGAEELCALAAKDLYENKIVAWFEGRSEIGPRALGHRSILANPTYKQNHARLNQLKNREAWRPFAPAVLAEHVKDWFSMPCESSSYMLFTGQVLSEKLPAVTHVDNSARIQTVSASAGKFYNLLNEFHKMSGVPVLLNTSFNGRNEPIVETPEDAVQAFFKSDIDVMYLENYRVWKE